MKSGSLNLLEHSGPHRACYGTPLPLPYRFITAEAVRNLPESGDAPGSTVFRRRPLDGLLYSPAAVSDDVMLGSRMSRCEPLSVTICGVNGTALQGVTYRTGVSCSEP